MVFVEAGRKWVLLNIKAVPYASLLPLTESVDSLALYLDYVSYSYANVSSKVMLRLLNVRSVSVLEIMSQAISMRSFLE